uniref:Uncharacterized protein n=1 Tax=Rhodnius prolixus TaxID=13249 RepID=T1I5P3_RHOPR
MTSALCNEFNISASLKFVSSELEILGYPEVLYSCGNEKTTFVELINITWTLIADLKRLSLKGNERTVELAKLKSQLKTQNEEKLRLEKLLCKERNATLSIKESLDSTLNLKKTLERELREYKKEIKNLKKIIDIQNMQYGNELLGKENTIANLKFKLNKFVNNDNSSDKEELFVQKHLPLTKYPKLKEYVNSLNNNVQWLILDNANLRNLILKIMIVLSDKLSSKNIDEKKLSEQLLNLPGEDLIVKLEKEFKNILNQFKI